MGRRRRLILSWAVIAVWGLVVFVPLYWIGTVSLKTGLALNQETTYVPWVDFEPTFGSWRRLIDQSERTIPPLLNSALIATASSAVALLVSTMAAVSLSRFPDRRLGPFSDSTISFLFLAQRMFPTALLAIPLLVTFRELRLLDTHIALIITYTAFGIPFAVWLLREFIRRIPIEIEDAAMVDGCDRMEVIRHVTIPLAAPGLVAVFILLFITAWNEFYFASVLSFFRVVTAPLWISHVGGRMLAAVVIVTTIPPIVAGLLLERLLRRGLLTGGIKG